MNNYYIENIYIKEVMNIIDLNIPLSKQERKHLIITGKNGSGKTTLLKAINILLNKLIANGFENIKQLEINITNYVNAINSQAVQISNFNSNINAQIEQKKLIKGNSSDEKQKIIQIENAIKSFRSNISNSQRNIKQYEQSIRQWEQQISEFTQIDLNFHNEGDIYESIVKREFILAFFEAKRENVPTVSNVIQNITINTNYTTSTNQLHKQFIEYMVKKRTDMLNDKFDGDGKKAKKIEQWFENFENTLKLLFNESSLKLKYYSEELNFKIEYGNKKFALNELSDGYSSLLAIVTELILRMEAHNVELYDMQGVILIDEIETHLHIELQKQILPFLTNFFPNLQFIVTTHSPFVLSSLSNTVICDLENNIITEDLSDASYTGLVRKYFGLSSEYSNILESKFVIFEELSKKENLSDKEQDTFIELDVEFKNISPLFSPDMYSRYLSVREQMLNDKH